MSIITGIIIDPKNLTQTGKKKRYRDKIHLPHISMGLKLQCVLKLLIHIICWSCSQSWVMVGVPKSSSISEHTALCIGRLAMILTSMLLSVVATLLNRTAKATSDLTTQEVFKLLVLAVTSMISDHMVIHILLGLHGYSNGIAAMLCMQKLVLQYKHKAELSAYSYTYRHTLQICHWDHWPGLLGNDHKWLSLVYWYIPLSMDIHHSMASGTYLSWAVVVLMLPKLLYTKNWIWRGL